MLVTYSTIHIVTKSNDANSNVYFREAVDVPLSFKLKNGESQFFTCRVTYEIVENGEKVTRTQVRPLCRFSIKMAF
jgi:hypothetical protein